MIAVLRTIDRHFAYQHWHRNAHVTTHRQHWHRNAHVTVHRQHGRSNAHVTAPRQHWHRTPMWQSTVNTDTATTIWPDSRQRSLTPIELYAALKPITDNEFCCQVKFQAFFKLFSSFSCCPGAFPIPWPKHACWYARTHLFDNAYVEAFGAPANMPIRILVACSTVDDNDGEIMRVLKSQHNPKCTWFSSFFKQISRTPSSCS